MTTAPGRETFTFESGPDEVRAAYVAARLIAFNEPYVNRDEYPQSLELYALDDTGEISGGLTGRTTYGWLEISAIWVKEDLRGRGIGAELLRRAEAEAERRGCIAARLSTWDFQAPHFYRRLGYLPYGKLAGYPPGHTIYYLRKTLAAARAST